MSKRGLSTVITTLILILLVLVAIGIVWVVISNVIKEGVEEVSLGRFTISLDIKSVNIKDDGTVDVKVKRNPGKGDLSGIKFIIDDGFNTQVFEESTTMGELGEKTFTLNYVGLVKEVSIAPILKSESGRELFGNVLDKEEFTSESCLDILNNGGSTDGIYEIEIGGESFEVYCDMTTDGGGWTLIAANNETTIFTNFNKDWDEYKKGFGNLLESQTIGWIGNERMNILTSQRQITLQVRSDTSWVHTYEDWNVNTESNNYKMTFDAGASTSSNDGNLFDYHNNMGFSTYDRDNDVHSSNCANVYSIGWWLRDCYQMTIAGNNDGQVYWRDSSGSAYTVNYIQMWIR